MQKSVLINSRNTSLGWGKVEEIYTDSYFGKMDFKILQCFLSLLLYSCHSDLCPNLKKKKQIEFQKARRTTTNYQGSLLQFGMNFTIYNREQLYIGRNDSSMDKMII